MVNRVLPLAAAAMIFLAPLAGATSARMAHPLHTTLTEMTVDPAKHTVRAVVRVFEDDVRAALSKRPGGKVGTGAVPDVEATAYVLSELTIDDESLRPVALRSCGVKRSGDVLWICVETGPIDPRTVRVRDSVLCELFADQVNIVQVSGAGVARSILFTRGDGPKTLR